MRDIGGGSHGGVPLGGNTCAKYDKVICRSVQKYPKRIRFEKVHKFCFSIFTRTGSSNTLSSEVTPLSHCIIND